MKDETTPQSPARQEQDLVQENVLLTEEVAVARRASTITAQLVVNQIRIMEEFHQNLQAQAEVERELRERLTDELTEAEKREKELAEARHAAEAANRAKSTFLANMSHELRTPLNAIIGYCELLQEEAADAGYSSLIGDLSKIGDAGRHLLKLINDVLDLSKIEAGKFDIVPEKIDIVQTVADVVDTIGPVIAKNGNRLHIECPEDIGTMFADIVRIRQCLLNILANAAKFTSDGDIHFRVRRTFANHREHILFEVQDTGIGITPEQKERLFQPFTPADASFSRKYEGTGLGLTITKRFCELMGGEVHVDSVPRQGSTFTISLPADEGTDLPRSKGQEKQVMVPPPPPTPPTALPVLEDAATVLVIDDDPVMQRWIASALSEHRVRLISAPNGGEGLRLAREHRPQVIILDVVMPGMDGWAVLSAIKGNPELSDIPVIMSTMVHDRGMGYALGVSDFLTKPIDNKRLISVIERFCHGGRARPVLVVDDDAVTRETLRRTLERDSWTVIEAADGRIGIDWVNEITFGLILLDLVMPEMDGFEFLELLRANDQWQDIPVVVVTSKDLSRGEREKLEQSVQRVLQKGTYSRSELLREVNRLILAPPPSRTDARSKS
jgi:signal transduction histidine kinase/CheY-like chemotaxis protein